MPLLLADLDEGDDCLVQLLTRELYFVIYQLLIIITTPSGTW